MNWKVLHEYTQLDLYANLGSSSGILRGVIWDKGKWGIRNETPKTQVII